MLGKEAVDLLHGAHVIIAGLGAVGGFAMEALARCGIGHFTLIDCDTIKPSNINRQLIADWGTVGEKKTEIAKNRILSINPNANVDTVFTLLNRDSIQTIIPEITAQSVAPCWLVDAIDSLGPKVELIAKATELKLPFISSMGAALRLDPTLVRIGSLSEVTHCRLAAMLRKRLRRQQVNTDHVCCVYSVEPVREIDRDTLLPPEFSEDERSLPGRRRCVMGSLPTITGIFGLYIADRLIKNICQ